MEEVDCHVALLLVASDSSLMAREDAILVSLAERRQLMSVADSI